MDPKADDRVVEIGPGLGALTFPLSQRVTALQVIEIDRDIAAQLAAEFPPERLIIHQGDVLKFDLSALGPRLRLIGNLPYNISSPMLFHAAAFGLAIRDCHFMLQREVVDRMAAGPGSKVYGRLSVMLQYRFLVEKLFEVPAGAFRPTPKVDSAFVRLTPHVVLPAAARDERLFAAIVTKAFSQRRKTLRNAVADYASGEDLAALRIDARLRPEGLSVEDFVRVANAVAQRSS